MERIVILDNEYATLWCYPKKEIVHHQFHKFANADRFQEVLTKGAEAFKEHRCTKWLSDDRAIGIVHPDDAAWGEKNWTPTMIKAGWKYWAVLMPSKTTGQMGMKKIAEHFMKNGITLKTFIDTDEAMLWLINRQ